MVKLKNKKPVLQRLSESIPWESFRLLLDKGYAKERKSSAGRRRIDPLILFKMLVLQQLFNLSDAETEFQVNDRRSFEKFVGLGVMNDIPDATTLAFFRERLRKAGVIEELFEMFESYLMQRWFQFRSRRLLRSNSNVIVEKTTRRSKRIACLKVGITILIDCKKRI